MVNLFLLSKVYQFNSCQQPRAFQNIIPCHEHIEQIYAISPTLTKVACIEWKQNIAVKTDLLKYGC